VHDGATFATDVVVVIKRIEAEEPDERSLDAGRWRVHVDVPLSGLSLFPTATRQDMLSSPEFSWSPYSEGGRAQGPVLRGILLKDSAASAVRALLQFLAPEARTQRSAADYLGLSQYAPTGSGRMHPHRAAIELADSINPPVSLKRGVRTISCSHSDAESEEWLCGYK
jgi:hypothetical protein